MNIQTLQQANQLNDTIETIRQMISSVEKTPADRMYPCRFRDADSEYMEVLEEDLKQMQIRKLKAALKDKEEQFKKLK